MTRNGRRPLRVGAAVVLAVVVTAVAACDDTAVRTPRDSSATPRDSSATQSTAASVTVVGRGTQPPSTLPDVTLIGAAVRAVEAQLGGQQQFFEINVRAGRVNLFVALNNATAVAPFTYTAAGLESRPAQSGASGHTFAAATLAGLTPAGFFDQVRGDLAAGGSWVEALEIVADAQSQPRFTIVISSAKGGQLLVVVDRQGKVIGTDTNILPGTTP